MSKEEFFSYLTSEEIEKLLNQFNERYFNPTRNKVMIQLFLASGLILSEMINLKWSNVDMQTGRLKIIKEEDEKASLQERTLKINDEVMIYLLEWKERQEDEVGQVEYVFSTGKGNKLSPRQVRQTIYTYAERAGIQEEKEKFYTNEDGQRKIFDRYFEKKVRPMSFRHTFALNKLEETGDLEFIAELLGHSNVHNIKFYKQLVEFND